ncbi:WXG100 family type VII secretion target [Streptomyces kronopolitis]|uniref:WXG100 family type VII secretion target n=1 Tax=Streptomyces kronopolitis TaxID=1612435 RepID=UPI00342EBB6F
MASKDSEFKPAKVPVPEPPKKAAKGSGEAQEGGHEVIASRPQFTEKGLNDLKAMVSGANPEEVGNVARGWRDVRVALVGESWREGIKKHFDDAVTKVLQSWHGSSADQFATSAQKISDNFANLALYPHHTGEVLRQIGENLKEVQKFVDEVKEPSSWESKEDWLADKASSGVGKGAAIGNTIMPGAGGLVGGIVGGMVGGDGRDDSQLKVDLQNPKMSIWDAMDKNRTNLSLGKERQLQAAHYMEQLGTTYRAGVKSLASSGGIEDERIKPPNHDGDVSGAIPGIGAFGPMPCTPKTGAPAGKTPGMKGGGYTTPQPMEPPRPQGIDGGIGSVPKAPAPNIGTGLDGLSGGPGLGTGGGVGAGGIGAGAGGGVGTGGLGAGSGTIGAGSGSGMGGSGVPGMVGGAGATGGARAGGAGSGARAGGAGAGAGARGGRAGMPGMGGAAGAAKGAGAKGAGAGGTGGALARQKGGVIGGKGGKLGAAGQGGSGLHRSRGGTQQGAGAGGGRRPAGMAGAHGAHGAKGKDKKGENGERPDYLVEDEETWTPERNVAPKVIE